MTNALTLYSKAFRDLFGNSEKRQTALSVLAQDPVQALTLLQNPKTLGFTTKGAADALDSFVEVLPDKDAGRIMEENLTSERLAELLAERGDLSSSAALLATPGSIMDAIRLDVVDSSLPEMSMILYSWAQKLHERADWSTIIELKIGGKTMKWFLLMFIWNNAGQPGMEADPDDELGTVYDISSDCFEDVGLNADLAIEELAQLVARGAAHAWEKQLMRDAQTKLRKERIAYRKSPIFDDSDPPESQAEGLADSFGKDLL